MLTKDEIAATYTKRARRYNLTANLYYLLGFRENAYRKQAIRALCLEPGDTVVELCCGTGLNFAGLERAVGPRGRVIGVDLTEPMLAQARLRAERNRWTNVELVHADVGAYAPPDGLGGMLSTFAITLVPEYERIIAGAAHALAPGKRLVILDFKKPERAPRAVVRFGVWLTRAFGVTEDLAERHPWETVARHFEAVTIRELYLGFAYVVSGQAPARQPAG